MIKELIKLANHLDSRGLVKEADALDSILIKISDSQAERNTESLEGADTETLPLVENPATGAYESRGCRGGSKTPYCLALKAFRAKISTALERLPELKRAASLGPMDIEKVAVAMWNSMVYSPTKFNNCFVKKPGVTEPNCASQLRFGEEGISYRDINKVLKDKLPKLKKFRQISSTRRDDERSVTDHYGKSDFRLSGSPSDYGRWIESISRFTKASSITKDAKKGELSGSIMWDDRDFRNS